MAERLLIVEDELFGALDMQDLVESAGFETAGPYGSLASAMAAIDLGPQRFRAAVLDVRLPDGDVFPVADRLHAAGVRLIFHSGDADVADLTRRYPDAIFCAKPCPSAMMTRILTEILHSGVA